MTIKNAYTGASKDFLNNTTSAFEWQDNTIKHAMCFTAGSSYTLTSAGFFFATTAAVFSTGVLTCRIYAGDPTGPQTTLATSDVASYEMYPTAVRLVWFNLSGVSIISGNVYTIEVSTNTPLDSSVHCHIYGTIAAGGGPGNQYWKFSGGSWVSQGVYRLGFFTSDTTAPGIYIIRTDASSSDIFSASGPKTQAISENDSYAIGEGATLTRDHSFPHKQAGLGWTVALVGNNPGYVTCSPDYKYGMETINAGVTATLYGDATSTNSGWQMNPSTPDTSTKMCRLRFNGTFDSPITITNRGDAYVLARSWTIVNGYGSVLGSYVSFKFPAQALFNVNANSTARTDYPTYSISLDNFFVTGIRSAYGIFASWPASPDMTVRLDRGTYESGYAGGTAAWYIFYGSIPSTALSTCKVYISNSMFQRAPGATGGYIIDNPGYATGTTYYNYDEGYFVVDARFDETVAPSNFTIEDFDTYGTVKVQVDNISAIQPNDFLVIFDSNDREIYRCTRSIYEASLYDKPANCVLISGLINGETYSGWYSMFTRTSMVWSPKSTLDSATPNTKYLVPSRIEGY